jgi:hypothetical protein
MLQVVTKLNCRGWNLELPRLEEPSVSFSTHQKKKRTKGRSFSEQTAGKPEERKRQWFGIMGTDSPACCGGTTTTTRGNCGGAGGRRRRRRVPPGGDGGRAVVAARGPGPAAAPARVGAGSRGALRRSACKESEGEWNGGVRQEEEPRKEGGEVRRNVTVPPISCPSLSLPSSYSGVSSVSALSWWWPAFAFVRWDFVGSILSEFLLAKADRFF